MEIHHAHHHDHPQHKEKVWTHYALEFFMLFLAVYCGFLAENYREHNVETAHANELAKDFYDELKSDSATAVLKVNNRIRQEEALKYLMKYFKDSSLTDVSKAFAVNYQFGINFRTPSIFEPKTVVLDQLKNSGSLRYFKSEQLQKLVGDLSVSIHNISDRQQLESDFRSQYLGLFLVDHSDYDFWIAVTNDSKIVFDKAINDYAKSDSVIPYHLKGMENFDRQKTVNMLAYYVYNAMNSTRQFHIQKYIDLNAQILSLLRKEYDLK